MAFKWPFRGSKPWVSLDSSLKIIENPWFRCVFQVLLDELGDLLERAMARALQVGKLLARQLLEARGNARRAMSVSLVGFSAGAVAVRGCLEEG